MRHPTSTQGVKGAVNAGDGKPDETDERGDPRGLDCPQSETTFSDPKANLGRQPIALRSTQSRGEELHDLWIGIQGRKGAEIVFAPVPEQEPLRAKSSKDHWDVPGGDLPGSVFEPTVPNRLPPPTQAPQVADRAPASARVSLGSSLGSRRCCPIAARPRGCAPERSARASLQPTMLDARPRGEASAARAVHQEPHESMTLPRGSG